MSYRISFSVIKGLKPNQILDYLYSQKYTFKNYFKFDYLPIIALSLNNTKKDLNDFTFIYPIYFDNCKDLEIKFETLNKNEVHDSSSYIGNWDIPILVSKQFKVKAFTFEQWEGDFDFEIFENGITLYDFQSNYHYCYYCHCC